jgi:predicted transcriptional regulator
MQIQLTDEQQQRLRELALRRRASIAKLVRDFVDDGLRKSQEPDRAEAIRRFLASAGSGRSGHPDISRRHDDYLDEEYEP